ncbi:MAG: hypothetical protein HQK75_20140 [Candidatus Magnetomorum sp.]|nr:hypothetical protein [Candidatus Magnetomorum sp.]
MKQKVMLIFGCLFAIMISGNSFAESIQKQTTPSSAVRQKQARETEPQEKLGLEDAIHILKVLSGYTSAPPAFDATGTWAVQSVQNGVVRKGEVFLQMRPDGAITGYAELTSLPGLSTVTGQVHGLTFDLHLTSDFGTMSVGGSADAEGDSISGSFFLQDNVEVFWDGHKQTTQTVSGTYQHDTEQNILTLLFEEGGSMFFTIYEFTATVLSVNCNGDICTIWERKNGETLNLEGVWRNNQQEGVEQIITFYADGTFSNIQKVTQ